MENVCDLAIISFCTGNVGHRNNTQQKTFLSWFVSCIQKKLKGAFSLLVFLGRNSINAFIKEEGFVSAAIAGVFLASAFLSVLNM